MLSRLSSICRSEDRTKDQKRSHRLKVESSVLTAAPLQKNNGQAVALKSASSTFTEFSIGPVKSTKT